MVDQNKELRNPPLALSPKVRTTPSQQSLFQVKRVERIAYDELNLVEIPFTLPRRTPDRRTAKLSPDGSSYLTTSGDSLPTAVAQRVVLALLWMTTEQNRFRDPWVHFKLSQLVKFMYPHRSYRANARTLAAVQRELYRIAHTRIHHDRWWDRAANKHVKVSAALFDQIIEVSPELRLGTPFTVRWGSFIYDSVRAQYTKPLDIQTWLAIDRPLDLTLYRWLDRQLARKDQQLVASCQNFAKYKLLLNAQRLLMGGRTASSYVLGIVAESLERLNGLGVAVRLEVDRRPPDFRFTFKRIVGDRNEICVAPTKAPHSRAASEVQGDQHAHNIVLRFQRLFQGFPESATPAPPRKEDLATARDWLQRHNVQEVLQLLVISQELHAASQERPHQILYLKGVSRYLSRAEAVLAERRKVDAQNADALQVEALWNKYIERLAAEVTLDEEVLGVAAEEQADAQLPAGSLTYPAIRERVVAGLLDELRLEALGAFPRADFMKQPNTTSLRERLLEHHGYDPLEGSYS